MSANPSLNQPEPRKFAFYGRTATAEPLGAQTARAWQLAHAALMTERVGGRIVAEYFDAGTARRTLWTQRPQASRLLARLPEPDRGFEAVVCAPHAFPANGHRATASCFHRHEVEFWLPEVAGPLDPANPTHQLIFELSTGITTPRRRAR